MFRRVLTYQLILAVAVGPLFCCCTTGQLVASSKTVVPASMSPSATSSTRITSPCCAHKHQKPSSGRGQSDQNPTPSKPSGKCPCKDDSGKTETIQTGVASADVSTFLRVVTLDLNATFAVGFCTSCTSEYWLERSSAQGSIASLLSTDDLLFSHHKLRC